MPWQAPFSCVTHSTFDRVCAQVVPTEEESKALLAYPGPREELSPPEQFCLVMSHVPRVVHKVCAW